MAQAIQGTNKPRRHPLYLVTRYLLLFEGVLNLLAGVFEVGLRLVALALIFSALVAGDPVSYTHLTLPTTPYV